MGAAKAQGNPPARRRSVPFGHHRAHASAMLQIRRASLLMLLSLVLAMPTRAEELVGRFGRWTVARDGAGAQMTCLMTLRAAEAPGYPRIDMMPAPGGRLILVFGVRDITLTPLQAPDDRVRLAWQRSQGEEALQIRVAGMRMREVAGRPLALMHSVLSPSPNLIALVQEMAPAATALQVRLPQGHGFILDSGGFAEAYAAMKACNPEAAVGLP